MSGETDMTITIVFPSDYFDAHIPDEDYRQEYAAATDTGFDTLLYSVSEWDDGRLVLDNTPGESSCCIYRGWMMKPEKYRLFFEELDRRGLKLFTSQEQYERFHIFPEIYPVFGDDTARMAVYPDGEPDLDEIKALFRRFMIKDYVKSVKGTDFPAYFDNTVTKEYFSEQMEVFRKYRSGLYTGGICVKEYLDLKRYGEHTNEYRVFYMNGSIGTVCRNSLQQCFTPEPPERLISKYTGLDSPLYTIDYAELADGSWKIIEAGDGQVSGLSPEQDCISYYRTLYTALS